MTSFVRKNMLLRKFCIFFIFLSIVFCEISTNFLNEPISNSIIFAERRNSILFALSKAANETTYKNLIDGFLKLEKYAQNNSTEVFYDIALSFGTGFSKNFTRKEKLYDSYESLWCTKNDKCFELSRIENVEEVVTKYVRFNEPCPNRSYKKFILIISDVCMPFINKELDDYQKCDSEYRKIILMLPTKTEVDECKKQLGPQQYIKVFSSSELSINEFSTYTDMYVLYQSTWSKSIFNIFVVVDKVYEKALTTMLEPEINYADYDLCNEGSLVAHLQFIDGQFQMVANMTAPVNFADSKYITNNYRSLLYKRGKFESKNCDFVNSFLTTVKEMPLEDDKYQYNLLVLSDPYPSCLKADLLWNNSNRHFELVVLGVQKPEKDYSKFISFSKDSLNHLSYYTANEGMAKFWGDTSICRTYMPARNITDFKPELITTTPSNEFQSEDNKLWIIIGGFAMALVIIGCFVLIYFKLRHEQNLDSSINWSIKDDSSPSTLSSFINKAFPDISIEESNVFINFDQILGQGSTCTVYQAKINTSEQNEKIYAIKIPLQYDNNHLEEVLHELDIVKRLGFHSSICLPILCTTHREIPCIIFEKMETSLLNFVKNFFENGPNFPPKTLFLQILWQISNALEFIASKNIIHRDIAARNILFSAPNIAKLSDFGLWCECNSDSQIYFSSFRKKLPFKWLSIEAMKDKIFSEKSDIWSFGIVMYEMWSGGKVPYADKDANELTDFLLDGNRLKAPEAMDNDIAEIMESCWKELKEERPNFYELKTKIGNLLENARTEKYNIMQ